MIKILGFLIIVASSAKIGFDLSEKYCNRTKEIKAFINVLEKIKNEISFSNCIITDALSNSVNVKCKTIYKMIEYIVKKVEEDKSTLVDAFHSFINENSVAFEKEDMEEITRFFSLFGSGDRDDEIKNITNTLTNMKAHLQTAIENEKKYVKLFRTSGILAGCLIAIILA